MSDKRKWPRAEALMVAEEMRRRIGPFCWRFEIAGSIRRLRPEVGDIELVFVPLTFSTPGDLFNGPAEASRVDQALLRLLDDGVLSQRLNINGSPAWGRDNKLAVHGASGIAIDFFATTEAAWWNYLVCRTGGAISNTRIAGEAKARGWKWCPTRAGFERRSGPDRGKMVPMGSEREVFEFVRLPYLEPEKRA